MKKRLQPRNPQIVFAPNLNSTRHTIRHFLGAMRRHDPSLIEHGKRTAIYSLLVGQALQLPDQDLSDLCYAALLHDLGKLTLPNEVIQQNGMSMIGEYVMTECSPKAGAEILRSWPGLQGIAKLIALHHERWDGSGEPFGIRGLLIPLGARILSLTDAVDQLLTQKHEQISTHIDSVVRIIRLMAGTRFDPNLVEVFIETLVPSIKKLSLEFDSVFHCPTEGTISIFVQNFPVKKSHIRRHLRNLFEITSPISYNPTPALLSR